MSLPAEVEASYTTIIDGILAASDLSTISAKRVRKGLQNAVDHDITPQKDAITNLILARFDRATERQANGNGRSTDEPADDEHPPPPPSVPAAAPSPPPPAAPPSSAPMANGTSKHTSKHTSASPLPAKRTASSIASPEDDDISSALSSVANNSPDPAPAKKKHKKRHSTVEDDEEFARRLQAEENSRHGRTTRGGGANGGGSGGNGSGVGGAAARKRGGPARKKKDKVKKKKRKSARTLDGSDDSGLSSVEEKEVKRTGGFHKPMALSAPLSALLNETQLSRPQTVKKVWEHIKAHQLQDPADKRQIRCDDAMRAVFKSERVHMFTMNKILNQNLYALDE